MRVLINASNLRRGGGCQVATSFLEEISAFEDYDFGVVVSEDVAKAVERIRFSKRFKFFNTRNRPDGVRNFFSYIRSLKEIEAHFKPDIVFSIFGPTYWTPKSPHLMGFANPWCIYDFDEIINKCRFFERLKIRILVFAKRYFTKRNSKYFITETDVVKNRLKSLVSPSSQIFVVPNTYSHYFDEFVNSDMLLLPIREPDEFRFITISSNYTHKNLQIIRPVAEILSRRGLKVSFYVTILAYEYQQMFSGLEDHVINLGPVAQDTCPQLYSECDALFLPTLLECFSASYPEALKMSKLIVTSERDFAKTICGDAALYIDPNDAEDTARKIEELIRNPKLKQAFVENGKVKLKSFISARARAKKYIDICEKVVKENV